MEEGEEDGSRWDVNSTSEERDSLGLEVARESLKRGVVVVVMVEVGDAEVAEDVEVTRRRWRWIDDVEGCSGSVDEIPGALEEWSL